MISSGLESSAVGTAILVARARLIMVVGGLLAVVLSASLLAVTASARAQSRNAIDEELHLAGAMFVAELEARTRQLVAATRALQGDIALRDRARAILAGHPDVTGADVVMLLSPQGTIAADSLRPARLGAAFARIRRSCVHARRYRAGRSQANARRIADSQRHSARRPSVRDPLGTSRERGFRRPSATLDRSAATL